MSNFLERFGDLQVGCPAGMSGDVMTLSRFAETEHGQKYIGNIALTFNTLVESGMGDEQAITLAGAGAFLKDENNQLIGLASEPADSKKKLNQNFVVR